MFSRVFPLILVLAAFVSADVNPLTPAPGDKFNVGAQCTTSWDADTTGTWKNMTIQLNTGDNLSQVPLTVVAVLDGSDPATQSFSYPCPDVTLYSAVYFYQYTSSDSPNTFYTTRFAIADPNGNTVPPPNATQPDGKPIPWGTGALKNPSEASGISSGAGPVPTTSNSTVPTPSSDTSLPTSSGFSTSVSVTPTPSSASSSGSVVPISASPSTSANSTATTGGALAFNVPTMLYPVSFALFALSCL